MQKIASTSALLLAMILFGSFMTMAQYHIPVKEKCEQLKTRTLLIALYDEPSVSNEVIRKAIKDYWTISPVEFMPFDEFNKVMASGDTKYSALLPYEGEFIRTMERTDGFNGPVIHSKSFYFSHFDLAISLITGPNTNERVCTISFANDKLMTGDYLFTIQQISRLVNASLNDIKGPDYYDHKKNIPFVKTKTLLIPREYVKESDIDKIKDKYEFPFKVVSLDEMNSLVLAGDEQYIYPKIIWSIQHSAYGWVTIYAKDGSITSFMSFGGVHFQSEQSANEVIKAGDFKYIASSMAQGMNNRYK